MAFEGNKTLNQLNKANGIQKMFSIVNLCLKYLFVRTCSAWNINCDFSQRVVLTGLKGWTVSFFNYLRISFVCFLHTVHSAMAGTFEWYILHGYILYHGQCPLYHLLLKRNHIMTTKSFFLYLSQFKSHCTANLQNNPQIFKLAISKYEQTLKKGAKKAWVGVR